MTPIEECPECGASLEVPDHQVGTRVECPDCRKVFVARATTRDDKVADLPRKKKRGRRTCPACGAEADADDRECPECDEPFQSTRRGLEEAHGKKVAAGICGILLGGFGVHKFILGFSTAGVIMLLVSLMTCIVGGGVVMHIIGLIEGIIYLTKSDREFHQIYMVEKKEWF